MLPWSLPVPHLPMLSDFHDSNCSAALHSNILTGEANLSFLHGKTSAAGVNVSVKMSA